MTESADFDVLPWLAAGVAAAVALLVLSRRLHPLFLIAGAFLVLAPLSLANDIEAVGMIKYVRLGATALMVLVGVAGYRLRFARGASAALLVFVAFYVAASLYSSRPHLALFYKGMFALTVLSGILLGRAARTTSDLLRGLRWLGFVAGVAGLVAFAQYAMDPVASIRVGRLSLWGLNANTVAMTAAALLILCVQLALYERSKQWRAFAILVTGLLGVEILATGSRGGLMMALVGSLLVALPFSKRPGRLAAVVLVFGAVTYAAMSLVELYALERFTDLTTHTRQGVWSGAWRRFAQSPIIGHGWIETGRGSTANVMNIYLQTLVETGVLGGAVLAVCLSMIAARARRMHRLLRRSRGPLANLAFLAIGLTAAVLIHGMIESGTFLGSTVNAFLLGFGVGLIDRLPELAAKENVLGPQFAAKPGFPGYATPLALPAGRPGRAGLA